MLKPDALLLINDIFGPLFLQLFTAACRYSFPVDI